MDRRFPKVLRSFLLAAILALVAASPCFASDCFNNVGATQTDCGSVTMYLNGSNLAVPATAAAPLPVTATPAVPVQGTAGAGYPPGAIAITGNATGTTGAVVGTLNGVANKFTYICGFNVSAIGGTASVGPVTVAGLIGSSQVYQVPVNSATNATVLGPFNFTPCIQASGIQGGITITTTANGTATAVDVNAWGYQQ